MAKYSIVELAVSNGNLVGIDQLSNNQKRALSQIMLFIYTEEQGQRKYILVRLCTLLNAISSITMEWKKSLVLLILIK